MNGVLDVIPATRGKAVRLGLLRIREGDSQLGAVAEQTPERILVYDLDAPLPVMRTFRPAQVRITPGSAWSHATAAQMYSESELEAIGSYLTWLVREKPAK